MPFDLPWVVTRFIQRLAVRQLWLWKRRYGLTWYALLTVVGTLLLANGQLSPQSARSYAVFAADGPY